MIPIRRIITMAALLALWTAVGTIGLCLIEGASWFDALYMVVITLSTVGYEDSIGLSDAGRAFIMLFLVCGLGIFTFSAFQIGQWIVSRELWSLREGRRMEREIAKLTNHFIVCGQGRMGTEICRYLHLRRNPFVVIDVDEERLLQTAGEHGWVYIVGDATDDDVLQKAGIERARSLASVLPTDADNVYVVLSARMLAGKLQIISRATEEKAVEKLARAGATRIVSPFTSGAIKMARFMLNPTIEDFLEIADSHGTELELADVQITESSPYAGKRPNETDLHAKGVMVVGIRRPSGERLMPPPNTTLIQPGDCLFAFGTTEAINSVIGQDARRNG